jgi:hypothetical protein
MTGSFPFLKHLGGHNTVTDLELGGAAAAAVALPFLAPLAPELLGAGVADVAAGAGAAGDIAGGLSTIGPGVAAAGDVAGGVAGGAGSLAGLTAADVTFLDPTLLGEAAIDPGVVPPALDPFAVGGDQIPFVGQGGLTTTGAGGLPSLEGGTPGTVADFSPSTIEAVNTAPGGYTGTVPFAGPTYGSTGGVPFQPGALDASISTGPTVTDPYGPGIGPGVNAAPAAGAPLNIAPGAAPQGFAENFSASLANFPGQMGKALGNPLTDLTLGLGAANLYSGYQANKQVQAFAQQEAQRTQQLDAMAAQAKKAAAPLISNGQTLMNYMNTGTLPKGLQDYVQQQTAAAKAARIQAAANMGQSTDPQYNTALGQDLAAIDRQQAMMTVQLETTLEQAGNQMIQTANQLISTGARTTDIAAQLPIMVQELDMKLAQQTSASLMSFAAALNGRGPLTGGNLSGITINTGGPTGPTLTA